MADLFISHAEEDGEVARQVADVLEGEGYSTWYYERDGLPGVLYLVRMTQAVDEAGIAHAELSAFLLAPGPLQDAGRALRHAQEATELLETVVVTGQHAQASSFLVKSLMNSGIALFTMGRSGEAYLGFRTAALYDPHNEPLMRQIRVLEQGRVRVFGAAAPVSV